MYKVMFRTSYISSCGATVSVVIETFPTRADAETAIGVVNSTPSESSAYLRTQCIKLYR